MQRYEPNGPTDPPPVAATPPKSRYKKAKSAKPTVDQIIIDPDRPKNIKEEKDGSHAMVIGGFSPFTIAHHEVVKQMQGDGHDSVHVFTTVSKKRPIAPEKKVGYIKKAVGDSTNVTTASTPLHAASKVYEAGHRGHLTFYGGSDRSEIADRIRQYNGREGPHGFYDFKNIEFKQVGGERKKGGSGMAGISGTAARASKSPTELKKFIPKALHPQAAEIFKDLKEEMIFEAAVLGVKQRLMRARSARVNKAKLALARKLAARRMARGGQLKRRSQKSARTMIRRRTAGPKGAAYSTASVSQKIALDRMVQNKQKAIQSIAKKLMPRVRQKEVQRLSGVAPAQQTKIPMMMSMDQELLKYYSQIIQECGLEENFIDSIMAKVLLEKIPTPTSLRGYRESNKKALETIGAPIKQQKPSQRVSEDKVMASLKEKAESSGVSLETIRQVYQRGLKARPPSSRTISSDQQSAFARVNSFLNKGKSFKSLDKDLVARELERREKKFKEQGSEEH